MKTKCWDGKMPTVRNRVVVQSTHAAALACPIFRQRVKPNKKLYRREKIRLAQALNSHD